LLDSLLQEIIFIITKDFWFEEKNDCQEKRF